MERWKIQTEGLALIRRAIVVIGLVIFFLSFTRGQDNPTLSGTVTDEEGQPVELVNVAVIGYTSGTSTDAEGKYELKVPADREVFIKFTFIGYQDRQFKVKLEEGEQRVLHVMMTSTTTDLPVFEIRDEQIRNTNYIRLDPKEAKLIPTISGGVEDLIKTLPGVTSTNELSSQYSVRGGNFDENLVYVNGIEIYRPFLIRSGQQEGLSFINSKLISSILFSAGGWDAKYGDKMSSVLDIRYKKPTDFGGSVEASLLGANVHLEGRIKERFTYLMGVRYKTNQYVLQGLDTQGNYQPNFVDVQGFFTYDISEKLELSVLGYYSSNSYKFIPETRETDFGTFQEAYRLRVFFDGQEVDRFDSYTGAVSMKYLQQQNLSHTFSLSTFRTVESETFDIQGQYWLGLLENAPGDEQFGDVVATQGVGTNLDHARNRLDASVYSFSYRGILETERNYLQWGVSYNHERIDDKLNEWELIDSAGYTLPRPPTTIGGTNNPSQLELFNAVRTKANINSNRINGYIQNSWEFYSGEKVFALTAGIRGAYWDYNDEVIVSPRATLSFNPKWEKDILFRLSAGYFYQPPFYRELRSLDGEINPGIRSQQSIHFVAGTDILFFAWERPFKFTAEAYYKYMDNLIPYVVDNVRIRYLGENLSSGYATGLDMKVNGEFIEGIESWASLSIMKTEEDIKNDFYYEYFNEAGEKIRPGITIDDTPVDSNRIEPGFIPRPTDQRVNFSIFFQDYLPRNPTYSIYLKLIFGTGMPFGPPNEPKYKHTLRYPPYRRVDIGLTKQLIGGYSSFSDKNPLRHINNAYVSLEVFNLLQIFNTISYTWVSDFEGRQYAVPNYLTPRLINLRLLVEF
jgi:hypothetical protein